VPRALNRAGALIERALVERAVVVGAAVLDRVDSTAAVGDEDLEALSLDQTHGPGREILKRADREELRHVSSTVNVKSSTGALPCLAGMGKTTRGAPMTTGTLAVALEREHRAIDRGIEAFLAGRVEGRSETKPLKEAMGALRRHIFLEEEFLFPPLREAGLVAPVFVMLREHGEIWATMDAIDAHLGTDAGGSSMAELCLTLLAQLEGHNSKEEPILYPKADAVLTATASADLKAFLAAGRIPAGWVCANAGA
jgi:regulator of cell morphogenesis and NO signaling